MYPRPSLFLQPVLGGDGLGQLLLSQSRCSLCTNMLLINVETWQDFTFCTSPVALVDISYCTSVIFSALMLGAISYELLETIRQEKTNTVGVFSWLITQTFHQISGCSQNYFHWHSRTLFVFFTTQLNEKADGPHLSILLWYIKTLNYVICDSGLIFGLNPWNCMALCVHASQPLSSPSHLSFVCFIFTHSKHVFLMATAGLRNGVRFCSRHNAASHISKFEGPVII